MRTEIVNVTPPLARAWLKRNTHNRHLRRTWVDTLKAAFARGEYVMSHQGVAFAENGEMIDGQHRVTAISELPDGCSFPMLVTTGLAHDEVFAVIDGGLRCTQADLTGRERREVEVARLLARMFSGAPLTPTSLIPVCERLSYWHGTLLDFCGGQVRTWSSAPVRAAAVLTMMSGGDVDYVLLVYRAPTKRNGHDRTAAYHYVSVALAATLTGLTEKAIRRKIEEGRWLEGREYRRAPDGGIFISMTGY